LAVDSARRLGSCPSVLKDLPLARSRARSDDSAFRELEAKVAALSTAGDDDAAGQARTALRALQKAMDARAAEIAKLERERKFNADELCYVSQEKSLVGRCVRVRELCGSTVAEGVTDSARPTAYSRPASAACKPDAVKEVSYEDYIALHKARVCVWVGVCPRCHAAHRLTSFVPGEA